MHDMLVQTVADSAILIGLSAGIGWSAKKLLKTTTMISDPSRSPKNYAKWTLVLAASLGLKEYLKDNKILPALLIIVGLGGLGGLGIGLYGQYLQSSRRRAAAPPLGESLQRAPDEQHSVTTDAPPHAHIPSDDMSDNKLVKP